MKRNHDAGIAHPSTDTEPKAPEPTLESVFGNFDNNVEKIQAEKEAKAKADAEAKAKAPVPPMTTPDAGKGAPPVVDIVSPAPKKGPPRRAPRSPSAPPLTKLTPTKASEPKVDTISPPPVIDTSSPIAPLPIDVVPVPVVDSDKARREKEEREAIQKQTREAQEAKEAFETITQTKLVEPFQQALIDYGEQPDILRAHGRDLLRVVFAARALTASGKPEEIYMGRVALQALEPIYGAYQTAFDKANVERLNPAKDYVPEQDVDKVTGDRYETWRSKLQAMKPDTFSRSGFWRGEPFKKTHSLSDEGAQDTSVRKPQPPLVMKTPDRHLHVVPPAPEETIPTPPPITSSRNLETLSPANEAPQEELRKEPTLTVDEDAILETLGKHESSEEARNETSTLPEIGRRFDALETPLEKMLYLNDLAKIGLSQRLTKNERKDFNDFLSDRYHELEAERSRTDEERIQLSTLENQYARLPSQAESMAFLQRLVTLLKEDSHLDDTERGTVLHFIEAHQNDFDDTELEEEEEEEKSVQLVEDSPALSVVSPRRGYRSEEPEEDVLLRAEPLSPRRRGQPAEVRLKDIRSTTPDLEEQKPVKRPGFFSRLFRRKPKEQGFLLVDEAPQPSARQRAIEEATRRNEIDIAKNRELEAERKKLEASRKAEEQERRSA